MDFERATPTNCVLMILILFNLRMPVAKDTQSKSPKSVTLGKTRDAGGRRDYYR